MTAFWIELKNDLLSDLSGMWLITAFHMQKDVKSQWAEWPESFKASDSETQWNNYPGILWAFGKRRKLTRSFISEKNDPVETILL